MRIRLPLLFVLLGACTDQTVDRPKVASDTVAPADEPPDASPVVVDAALPADATPAPADADAPIAGGCTSKFGSAVTQEFGRLDGRVRYVVVPGDFACPGDNNHAIVQVDVGNATYQVWVNVESERAGSDPAVRFFSKSASPTTAHLPGGAWTAGWHPSPGRFDYALDLGVRASSFTAMNKASLSNLIRERAKPGTRVMIYADGFGTRDGAHKVHRNSAGRDGAIVLDPTGTPVYLLFAFSTQTF